MFPISPRGPGDSFPKSIQTTKWGSPDQFLLVLMATPPHKGVGNRKPELALFFLTHTIGLPPKQLISFYMLGFKDFDLKLVKALFWAALRSPAKSLTFSGLKWKLPLNTKRLKS